MLYTALKHAHMTFAVLSLAGFLLRGYWMLTESALLQSRAARILPHINDSLLLAAAIGLMLVTRQYPFVHDWLTVKLFALIAYIVLGTIAIKRGSTKTIRSVALVAALLCFAFLVSVAITHQPLGFLANI